MFVGIIMCSEEEAIADMVHLGLSHDNYQYLLNQLKSKNASCYPSLDKVKKAKKRFYPDGMVTNPDSVVIPMQSVLDAQLTGTVVHHENGKLLADLDKVAKDPNVKAVTFLSKFGFDSHTQLTQFNTMDKFNHNSVFSSYLTPVALQVTYLDGREEEDLWTNDMANSPLGVSYLRQALEKEDDGNSMFTYLYPVTNSPYQNLPFPICAHLTCNQQSSPINNKTYHFSLQILTLSNLCSPHL